ATLVADEVGSGVLLGGGGSGGGSGAIAGVGEGREGGTGVLSSRADRRGAAFAFQRLFGIGPDLPPPPTEEDWAPPEAEGESPAACRQTLVDLFRVPLMTKEDISKYLDATDPVAGAAASEAAATAIKALGAPSLAGGAGGAAAKDAKVDAALANLSSPYPVVTPAASVYEVLGFAAQARHAKNYADLLAGASDAGAGGAGGVGGGGDGGGEKGAGDGGKAPVEAAAAAGEQAGVVAQPASLAVGQQEGGAGAGAGAAAEGGGAAAPAGASKGNDGATGSGVDGGSLGEVEGDTAEAGPAPAPAAPAADPAADSPATGGGAIGTSTAQERGTAATSPGEANGTPAGEGEDGNRIGSLASAFAAGVAAFMAPDVAVPLGGQLPGSESPDGASTTPPAAAAAPVETQAPRSLLDAGEGEEGDALDAPAGRVHAVGDGAAPADSGAPEAEGPASVFAPAAAAAAAAAAVGSPRDSGVRTSGTESNRSGSSNRGEGKTNTRGSSSSNSNSNGKKSVVSRPSASPCLALAARRPSVFAATLADDVLDALYADGAGATGRRGSELAAGASLSGDEEEVDEEKEEAKSGGGALVAEVESGCGDPATAVARAVEALLRGGGGGDGEGEDSVDVDAAEKACSGSASSGDRLLLALCQHARAASGDTPSTTTTTAATDGSPASYSAAASPTSAAPAPAAPAPAPGGESRSECVNGRDGDSDGDGGEGFSPIRLAPASFAALARLLRASLDRAASDREFLQARNCLVTAGLYSVDAADYVSWLRERDSDAPAASDPAVDGGASVGSSGGIGNNGTAEALADGELVSAAGMMDAAAAGGPGTGGE
ncbi:unnamed protein product, partial [Scytosiphon promiscuus]